MKRQISARDFGWEHMLYLHLKDLSKSGDWVRLRMAIDSVLYDEFGYQLMSIEDEI